MRKADDFCCNWRFLKDQSIVKNFDFLSRKNIVGGDSNNINP